MGNRGVLTLVCLLSEPEQFEGGVSCFEAAKQPKAKKPAAKLLWNFHCEACDSDSDLDEEEFRYEEPIARSAIIFRGEKLTHWVTPVTAGTRTILQVELSSI